MNRKSTEARQLNQERRSAERERDTVRHAARAAKYAPTRGVAGAW